MEKVQSFTFEQQRELLMLRLEHDKFKQAELEQVLAVKRLRQQTEHAKLEAERLRRSFVKEGKLSTEFDRKSSYSGQSVDGFDDFDQLGELVVLEQFKDLVPVHVAAYINEQKITDTAAAAALADDYMLTHGGGFADHRSGAGAMAESH
ncbi:hypothetical protein VZT92_025346 [Zoarces viviparus]|uniref:SCAN box domain-containing protein n=1 Tax=Zoarces viviparus TaxID=48416 RepID=A0AAW1DX37_ZOAVI